MKLLTRLFPFVFAAALVTTFTACEPKTPAEKAGERIEDATDGASDAVEKMGDKVEDATDGH